MTCHPESVDRRVKQTDIWDLGTLVKPNIYEADFEHVVVKIIVG